MIIKRKRTADYTVIANAPMNDDRLKADTLGVLCYLRSRPNNWEVMVGQLAARFSCGKDKIYRIIGELMEFGYIHRLILRGGSLGQFSGTEYHVYDDPSDPIPADAETGFPFPENPDTENTDALISKDLLPSKDSNKVRKPTKAEAENFFAEMFWPKVLKDLKRSGSQPKEPCRKKIVAAVLSGENPQAMLDSLERIAQDLRRRGKIGTEFVPMAVTLANRKFWNDDPGSAPDDPTPGGGFSPGGGSGGGQPSFFSIAAEIRARGAQRDR